MTNQQSFTDSIRADVFSHSYSISSAEFRSYFEHVRSLRFDDRPDYDYLKRLFRELFFRKGFSYDNMFDWELLAMQNQRARGTDEVAADTSQQLVENRANDSEGGEKSEAHEAEAENGTGAVVDAAERAASAPALASHGYQTRGTLQTANSGAARW
jgi:hypothetical protein